MNYLEKFDYGNFGKFINEIVSNPDVVKKRDFLVEKAYDWFEVSRDDITVADKDEIIKTIYKFLCLSFYIVFKNNPNASKIDVLNVTTVEKNFPDEIYALNKNIDNWQYFLTFYSGILDGLTAMVKTKDGKPFKDVIGYSENYGQNNDDEE